MDRDVNRDRDSVISGRVVIAVDATRDRGVQEFNQTVKDLRIRGDILQAGDTIVVLGVLHKVLHPMGYQLQVGLDSIFGAHTRAVEEQAANKVDLYVNMLMQTAQECEGEGTDIEVKIVAGAPTWKVVVKEVIDLNATWVVLDRHMRRDLRLYLKHIPCKVAFQADNWKVEVWRSTTIACAESIEHKIVFNLSKPVPLAPIKNAENPEQCVVSCKSYSASMSSVENSHMHKNNFSTSSTHNSQEKNFSSQDDFGSNYLRRISDKQVKREKRHQNLSGPLVIKPKPQKETSRLRTSKAPILCAACGMTTYPYTNDSLRFSFSQIQLATDNFSRNSFLGEGVCGQVYKGQLRDGQLIAAKVMKEACSHGFSEFHSEIYVLSFARHKNIVTMLGYCFKEDVNILVYEYICNKSLQWHLFDDTEFVLEWHRRYAIAIGTAKGLRFLHEECRSGPIIHRDLRPNNILLTHDFVPMLGDFGLAKWKTSEEVQTRMLGTIGYIAPEYAENETLSVRTDVYAFGILLLQLISGRRATDPTGQENELSLRQWAIPLIERLALHELVDARIRDIYDTYEMYNMAKTAFLCVQNEPEMRPSIEQVLRLLQGELDHEHYISEQFAPYVGN